MELPLNVDVECADGPCGRSTYIVLNPVSKEVTHLVVRDHKRPHTERMVPIKQVESSTHDGILLRCANTVWSHMDPFVENEFVAMQVPFYGNEGGMAWPYVTTTLKTKQVSQAHRNLPLHETDVHCGAHVKATDGQVGTVDEFVIDNDNRHITHLVMREGHLWGKKDVAIPVSAIKKIDEEMVTLNMDKASIEALPSMPIHRHFTPVPG